MKKTVNIYNLIERFKNKEINVKWSIVFAVWILLFFVSVLIVNCYSHDIVKFSLKTVFVLIIRVMLFSNIETLTVFFLTPRELTDKSANILIMVMLTITYLMRVLMLPLFFFGTIGLKIITVTVHMFRLHYMYSITKVYCSSKFRRGYILVLLEFLNLILHIQA